MTDCLNCSKIYSGNCKQCPGHLAELAAFERRIANHIHRMARVAWRLQPDRSTLSETKTNMVSSANSSPTPLYETQAGDILSYPNASFVLSPACKLSTVEEATNYRSSRSVLVPASLTNPFLPAHGAGNFFPTTNHHPPKYPNPAPIIIMRGN